MYMWIAIFISENDFNFSNGNFSYGHEEYIGVFETEHLAKQAVVDTLIYEFNIDDTKYTPTEILDEFFDNYMIDKVMINTNYIV